MLIKRESSNGTNLKEEEKGDKYASDIFKIEAKEEAQEDELSEEEDDEDEEEYDDNPADFITAQYEKVQRTKQKYKCIFKDVVMHINGKDYVVKRINADIEY